MVLVCNVRAANQHLHLKRGRLEFFLKAYGNFIVRICQSWVTDAFGRLIRKTLGINNNK